MPRKPKPDVYLATFESRHFEFSAVGRTEAEARAALRAGLDEHTKQYNLDADWYTEDDFNLTGMRFGHAMRDHSEI